MYDRGESPQSHQIDVDGSNLRCELAATVYVSELDLPPKKPTYSVHVGSLLLFAANGGLPFQLWYCNYCDLRTCVLNN